MPGQSGFLIQFIRLAGPFWNSENKAIIRKRIAGFNSPYRTADGPCSHHHGMERRPFQCA